MRSKDNWYKAAKIAMLYSDVSYDDIRRATGFSRSYVSAIINGRMYSEGAKKKISSFLGIPDGDFSISIKFIPTEG